jgi:hypothetical protein
VARDDLLAAFTLAVAAFLGRYGLKTIPEVDSRGLRVEIVYPASVSFRSVALKLQPQENSGGLPPTIREAPVVWHCVNFRLKSFCTWPLAMGGEAAEESNSGKLREAIIQALATAYSCGAVFGDDRFAEDVDKAYEEFYFLRLWRGRRR